MRIERFENLIPQLSGKSVLFIATKNIDYIRITQEKELFEKHAVKVDYVESVKNGYFARILEVLIKLLWVSMKKYDLVFVGFQAQFIIPLFYWKFRKKMLWSDFFISLYDTLIFDRQKFGQKSLVGWLTKKVDQFTVDKSDVIICDTMAHGTYFCEEFNIPTSKMYVLYLRANNGIYYPRNVEKLEEYKNKYIVFYFGSILPLQGVDIVLGAIKQLQQEDGIHFIIVGPIGNKIKKEASKNVTYIDWLTQERLAEYIAMSDLCLAGHFNGEINKAKRTIPGKAYIYDAMGKKMILGDNLANKELHDKKDSIYVKMGDVGALADAIIREYEQFIKHDIRDTENLC